MKSPLGPFRVYVKHKEIGVNIYQRRERDDQTIESNHLFIFLFSFAFFSLID